MNKKLEHEGGHNLGATHEQQIHQLCVEMDMEWNYQKVLVVVMMK